MTMTLINMYIHTKLEIINEQNKTKQSFYQSRWGPSLSAVPKLSCVWHFLMNFYHFCKTTSFSFWALALISCMILLAHGWVFASLAWSLCCMVRETNDKSNVFFMSRCLESNLMSNLIFFFLRFDLLKE